MNQPRRYRSRYRSRHRQRTPTDTGRTGKKTDRFCPVRPSAPPTLLMVASTIPRAGCAVCFSDFNGEVLEQVTIPNVRLNVEEHHWPLAEFFRGDWGSVSPLLEQVMVARGATCLFCPPREWLDGNQEWCALGLGERPWRSARLAQDVRCIFSVYLAYLRHRASMIFST